MASPLVIAKNKFYAQQPLTTQEKSLLADAGIRPRGDSAGRLMLAGYRTPVGQRPSPDSVDLRKLAPSPKPGPKSQPQTPPQTPLAGNAGPQPGTGQPTKAPPKAKAPPRMLTGEQLVGKMGRSPTANVKLNFKLGEVTLREMGQHYKAVLQAIATYQADIRTTRFGTDRDTRGMHAAGLAHLLDEVDKAATDHLTRHPGDQAMRDLKTRVATERQLLKDAAASQKLAADPRLGQGSGLSFHQAIELQRTGKLPDDGDHGSLDLSLSRLAASGMPGDRAAVQDALTTYRDILATRRIDHDPVLRKTDRLDLERALDKLGKAIDAHLQGHPHDRSVQKLKGQLAAERQQLQAVANDPAFAAPGLNRGKGYTFQQAMELQRFGIAPGPRITFDEVHTDQQIKKSNETFASGNLNTVARIEYADGRTMILKPEAERAGSGKTDGKMGIPTDQPHYGNRNIATRVVDEFLGTNMTTNAQYAIHNGRLHLIMDQAPGVSAHSNATVELPVGQDTRAYTTLQSLLAAGTPSAADIAEIEKTHKVKVTLHGDGSFQISRQVHVPYAIDYQNPDLARAMCNKELVDYLTGQGDRHAGNYFIDMDRNGRLLGTRLIDDDSSFGTWDDPEAILKLKHQGKFEGEGYNGIGMPLLFDKPTVDRLRQPGAWQTLEADLKGLLAPAELAAAKQRFDKLLAHLADPANGRLVITDWTARTLPPGDSGGRRTPVEHLLANPEKSYLGRDNAILQHKIGQGIKPSPLPG
jgi:hypothetical protein